MVMSAQVSWTKPRHTHEFGAKSAESRDRTQTGVRYTAYSSASGRFPG